MGAIYLVLSEDKMFLMGAAGDTAGEVTRKNIEKVFGEGEQCLVLMDMETFNKLKD